MITVEHAGQVTLGIWKPEDQGIEVAPNRSGFALRVPDVEAARAELEAQGVRFDMPTFDTGVCQIILHRRYAP